MNNSNNQLLPGVFVAKKKNGDIYYRASITYKSKHISLSSYASEEDAHSAYLEARAIIDENSDIDLSNLFERTKFLDFKKAIILYNFKVNGIYIKTPIFLRKGHIEYYLDPHNMLIFDIEDLFYYSTHSISVRGGHMFVADYGSQYNILDRYGIKSYSVLGRDYIFANGNEHDYRYENIIIINKYHGVRKTSNSSHTADKNIYEARILLDSELLIGRYEDEITAAIAYNKACDIAKSAGWNKSFITNYIEEISAREYADIYSDVTLRDKFIKLCKTSL